MAGYGNILGEKGDNYGYDRSPGSNPFSSPRDVEMQQYSSGYGKEWGSPTDGGDIFDECDRLTSEIGSLRKGLNELISTHRALMIDAGPSGESAASRFQAANSELMKSTRAVVEKVRLLKSRPDATNPQNTAQVALVDSRMKEFMADYRKEEEQMHTEMEGQQVRQYRIAVPDASDEEAREVVRQPNQGIFQQAVCPFSFYSL